jgi:hypothetical protein
MLAMQNAVAQPVAWLNHLDFLPGDETVDVDYQSVECPGTSGLSGLAITSTTLGDNGPSFENKVISKGVPVSPGFKVNGVRVCYESTSAASFITQVRLCQLKSPPDSCVVQLDDGTDLTDPGPVCVNSATPFDGAIDPNPEDPDIEGALRLSLRVNFGDLGDTICLRGIGLIGTSPEKGAAKCLDLIDNDGDGATDCDDTACSKKPFCS